VALRHCSFGAICGNMPSSACPHLACIMHCRHANMLASGQLDDHHGNIGQGCDFHESKVLAREERRKMVRDIRNRRKRDRCAATDSDLLAPHRRRIGVGPPVSAVESNS
jgi:hypothetical protein